MGICAAVECPKCHGEFVVSPSMLTPQATLLVTGAAGSTAKREIDFHCPFCNAYFPKEESPRIEG